MWSKCLTITSNYLNMEPSPWFSVPKSALTPGKYPRYFPASSPTYSIALGHHQHCIPTYHDPSFAAELPGKQPPLMHAYIAYSFSLLLALEITATTAYPISDA
jgi:hypothetical protein